MALLSIITVVNSDLEGLSRTYDSLCRQEDTSFEWIVQDGTKTPLKTIGWESQERFILRYFWGPDKSCYDAMNKAVRSARGRWIWFLNAGDTCFDIYATRSICSRAEGMPDWCVISFGYIDEESGETRLPRNEEQCRGLYSYRTTTSHQATVYSAKIFENFKYNIKYKIFADHELFWRLQRQANTSLAIKFTTAFNVIAYYQKPGLSGKSYLLQAKELYLAGRENKIKSPYLLAGLIARFGLWRFRILWSNCKSNALRKSKRILRAGLCIRILGSKSQNLQVNALNMKNQNQPTNQAN